MLRVAVARIPDATPERDASRVLLRTLLESATGVPGRAWEISAPGGVAPAAHAPGLATGAIHVSLSHRLGWVAAAVSDAPVGVDIECDRAPRSDPDERALLMLAPAEVAEWHALPEAEREAALLTRWTAKEAWFKASPPGAAPWDFRRVAARACAPGDTLANVRTWTAPPLHLALCSPDAAALAQARCELSGAGSSWHVHPVVRAN